MVSNWLFDIWGIWIAFICCIRIIFLLHMPNPTYTAVILKKQPYGEGDELVTFFTRESGKIRALAKSVKLPKSKLSASLQVLFCVSVQVAGSRLPKIIGVQVTETYAKIRESLKAIAHAYYALETVIKFTPDEQPNDTLYNALTGFLAFLDTHAAEPPLHQAGLLKFKLQLLESLGLALHVPKNPTAQEYWFSNSRGGFLLQAEGDAQKVSGQDMHALNHLESVAWHQVNAQVQNSEYLNHVLSSFLEYYMERKVKADDFLNMV